MNKVFVVMVCLLAAVSFSYAGEMAAQEASARFSEGVQAQSEGNYDVAHMMYQRTLLLDNNNMELQKSILNNYGVMFLEENDIANAQRSFEGALNIDPNYQPAMLNLGLVYDKQPDKLKALQYWLQVYGIDINSMKPQAPIVETKEKLPPPSAPKGE